MAPREHPADGRQRLSRSVAIPVVLVSVTVAVGTVGVYQQFASASSYQASAVETTAESVLTSLSFLVLGNGSIPTEAGAAPVSVYVARATGALFFSYAAVLGFAVVFAERLKPVRISFWRLRDRLGGDAGHVVVCGLGETGFALADQLLDHGHDVVAVDPDAEPSRVRELSDRGAVVLHEDATRDRTMSRRAKVQFATEVFVNCGDDRTNTRVARCIAGRFHDHQPPTAGDPVSCHVHLRDRSERYYLRDQLADTPALYPHVYDKNHATARELLIRRPVDPFSTPEAADRTHVVLLGWNERCLATIFELCQTMHYPDGYGRAITVACRDPEAARRELHERIPALDPGRWASDSTAEFVDRLLPSVAFVTLPANEDVLLSDRFALYGRLETGDSVTLIVTEEDSFRSTSLVSTIRPRLEALCHERAITATVHHFVDREEYARTSDTDDGGAPGADHIRIRPFTEFVDRCTPDAVRGARRDRVAKRIALFFHCRYAFDPTASDPTAVDAALSDRFPRAPADPPGYGYEALTTHWSRLDAETRRRASDVVWRSLPEHHRDANRYAADHVPIKHRIADTLGDTPTDDVEAILSAIEHRRWCVEKFLAGWEPLAPDRVPEWRSDDDAEARLREQKYHLDLLPLDELVEHTDGDAEKDRSLVRFTLEHLRVADRAVTDGPHDP